MDTDTDMGVFTFLDQQAELLPPPRLVLIHDFEGVVQALVDAAHESTRLDHPVQVYLHDGSPHKNDAGALDWGTNSLVHQLAFSLALLDMWLRNNGDLGRLDVTLDQVRL